MKVLLMVFGLISLSVQAKVKVNEIFECFGEKISKERSYISLKYSMDKMDNDTKKRPYYKISLYDANENSKGAVWAPLGDRYYPEINVYASDLLKKNQLSKYDLDAQESQSISWTVENENETLFLDIRRKGVNVRFHFEFKLNSKDKVQSMRARSYVLPYEFGRGEKEDHKLKEIIAKSEREAEICEIY